MTPEQIEYLQIGLEALILFIFSLHVIFLQSYKKEKGKNLATKEDIEEITRKVEAVKNDLQFSHQLKFSFKTEERNSLIECYEAYAVWYKTLVDFNIERFTIENFDILSDEKHKINSAYVNFINSQAKMVLYVKDGDLLNTLKELKKETQSFSNEINNELNNYQSVLKEIQFNNKFYPKFNFLQDKVEPSEPEKTEALGRLQAVKEKNMNNLKPISKSFIDQSYSYLTSLSEK